MTSTHSATTLRALILLTFMVGLPVVALLPQGTQVSLGNLWNRELAVRSEAGDYPPVGRSRNDLNPMPPLSMAPPYQPASDRMVAPALYKPPTSEPQVAREPSLVSDRSEQLEEELHNLGATYYRMESWGTAPRKYRFHCTVAIKIGLAEYSQRFEETADHPLTALERVLEEVRTWHDRFDPDRIPAEGAISAAR